jgi:hypothetical protein
MNLGALAVTPAPHYIQSRPVLPWRWILLPFPLFTAMMLLTERALVYEIPVYQPRVRLPGAVGMQ